MNNRRRATLPLVALAGLAGAALAAVGFAVVESVRPVDSSARPVAAGAASSAAARDLFALIDEAAGLNGGSGDENTVPSAREHLLPTHVFGLMGLAPETLAAAGGTSADLAALAADCVAHSDEDRLAILASANTTKAAQLSLREAQRQLATASADSRAEAQSRVATARTQLTRAQQAAAALRVSIRERVLGALDPAKHAAVAQVIEGARWGVPEEYRLATHTEAEWVRLRDALKAQTQVSVRGGRLDAATASFLEQVEQNEAVQAARRAKAANSAALRAAWTRTDSPR